MNQYYKAQIKIQFEDKKGNLKYKRDSYIVSAVSPTDVEAKLAKHLGVEDYEVISISLVNIIDIIQ